MPESVLNYALTTKGRIKTRLGITSSDFDTLIERLINGVTDFIQGATGRHFKETSYLNEVYSVEHNRKYLFLRHFPVSAVSSFEYKAGTPTSPNWTKFDDDEWELVEGGRLGIIRFYGSLPSGTNAVRVSYTAGYKIDWENVGDTTKHDLPADLTDLAERLVIKLFKHRESEGKASESFEGGGVTWAEWLSLDDKAAIEKWRRVIFV